MAKKNKNKGGSGVRKAIKAAGPVISNKEMKKIVKAAGGNVKKAVNRIASVQQKAPSRAAAPVVASGAANMLIKQAQKAPATQQTDFGTSKLGQTLQGMVAQPATSGTMIKGQQVGATPAQAGSLVPGGMVIRPGGTLAVQRTAAPQVTPTPDTTPAQVEPTAVEAVTPYQAAIDALTSQVSDLQGTISMNDQYMQDYINQTTLAAQQQSQQMSEMFNAQIAQQEAAYQQQVQQANLLAQQEQEAARAFMINQGRMINPANLQIGATYGTPQLAGTQGFKYRPERTPTTAQVATAFTAPTLAAAAMTPQQQQLQPTVLNV